MPPKKPKVQTALETVSEGPVHWINVRQPSKESLAELKDRFPFFLDIDLKDCLPPFERPKLLERGDYLFLVLLFPVLDEQKRHIHQYEVDFFIGRDFVVTSHAGTHETLEQLTGNCGDDSDRCIVRATDDPLRLAHDIVHGLTVSCFPLLTRISNDLVGMEDRIFAEADGKVLRELLRVRSNILSFRRSMQGHEASLERLLTRGRKFFDTDRLRPHFADIGGHEKEIHDFLENYRESVDALYESHISLVSYKTNKATKTLTALAFVIFPTALVASLFSMKAEHTPFVGLPGDFWIMVGVVGLTMLGLITFMKKKRLL